MELKTNYKDCSIEDLEDICRVIDREKYPERYQSALSYLREKRLNSKDLVKPKRKKKPVSKNFLISGTAILLIWVVYSLLTGEVRVRGRVTSIIDSPKMYWSFIIIFFGLILYNLTYIYVHYYKKINKQKQSDA